MRYVPREASFFAIFFCAPPVVVFANAENPVKIAVFAVSVQEFVPFSKAEQVPSVWAGVSGVSPVIYAFSIVVQVFRHPDFAVYFYGSVSCAVSVINELKSVNFAVRFHKHLALLFTIKIKTCSDSGCRKKSKTREHNLNFSILLLCSFTTTMNL